jgi:hypothetical protein
MRSPAAERRVNRCEDAVSRERLAFDGSRVSKPQFERVTALENPAVAHLM